MINRRSLASSLLALAALSACDDERALDLPETTTTDAAAISARDAASVTASCDQAADGTPCGDAGAVMHCLYNACVLNVCGDGVKAGDEICDDGDQEDADGCNSHCAEPECGNGLIDAREQCDDGNASDGDDCSSTCRDARLGAANGGTDAGASAAMDGGRDAAITMDSSSEKTDATNGASDSGADVTAMDTGMTTDAGIDSGALDAGPAVDSGPSACQQCVRAATSPCRDFFFSSPDNVVACFENPDPTWVEQCVAVYRCAVNSPDNCGADPTGVTKCYCGTTPIETCFSGVAPNGRCIAEVHAATGCSTPQCVEPLLSSETMRKATYPAYFLTLCTTSPEGCGASCPPGQRFP